MGRNALNFYAPTYAADVVSSKENSQQLRQKLQEILVRNDPFPVGEAIASLMPNTEEKIAINPETNAPGRVLLIVGSPKVKSSTSAVLGEYVLKQLKQKGWESEIITLRGNLFNDKGKGEFLAAIDQANLILLAFPLYIDSLPFLMMKSLETIAQHISNHPQKDKKRLLAIANNGFLEAHHNAIALAICQRFAIDTNMIWSGGLAIGAGEALFGGLPISKRKGRPPIKHIIEALNLASEALASGQNVPPKAAKLMTKTPIPLIPFKLWRWLFIKMANYHWRPLAAKNQVDRDKLFARPYAEVGSANAK